MVCLISPFRAQTQINNMGGYLCTVLDIGNFRYGKIAVYEDAINSTLETNIIRNQRKRYYYIPSFIIDSRTFDVTPINSEESAVYMEIQPLQVRVEDIVEHIRLKQDNRDVIAGNIQPLCSFGYKLIFRGHVIDVGEMSFGNSMSEPVLIDTKLAIGLADQFAEHIQSGKAVKLHCNVDTKITCLLSADYSTTQLKQSQAYRNYISPYEDNVITVEQRLKFKNLLLSELKRTVIVDDCFKSSTNVLSSFIEKSAFRKKELLYDASRASDYLINLEGARFSSDEINEIVVKSHIEDSGEWSKTYEELMERISKRQSKGEGKGNGGLEVFKIFKVNGSGDKMSEKKVDVELKNHLKDSETAKHFFSNLFEGKWAGKRFIPKGIYNYELIDLDDTIHLKDFLKQEQRGHETRIVELIVRMK